MHGAADHEAFAHHLQVVGSSSISNVRRAPCYRIAPKLLSSHLIHMRVEYLLDPINAPRDPRDCTFRTAYTRVCWPELLKQAEASPRATRCRFIFSLQAIVSALASLC